MEKLETPETAPPSDADLGASVPQNTPMPHIPRTLPGALQMVTNPKDGLHRLFCGERALAVFWSTPESGITEIQTEALAKLAAGALDLLILTHWFATCCSEDTDDENADNSADLGVAVESLIPRKPTIDELRVFAAGISNIMNDALPLIDLEKLQAVEQEYNTQQDSQQHDDKGVSYVHG